MFEYQKIKTNQDEWNIVKANLNPKSELIIRAARQTEQKVKHTIQAGQDGIIRSNSLKLQNQFRGMIAEIYAVELLKSWLADSKLLNWEVIRYDDVRTDKFKSPNNEYDIKIPLESVAIRKVKAQATWWLDGYRMHYSYNLQNKFVDNLWVVLKVIELESRLLISKEHTLTEFVAAFKEDKDIDKQRINAREHIGVAHDETDIETINQKYKKMARTLHPDMPTGDVEKFKKLNNAHKILKRELS